MHFRWMSLVFLPLALWTPGASARTLHVDRRSSASAPDGASWSTAYRSVIQAISAAQAGDEIWVTAGIYPERVSIKPGIRLYGGFVGTESYRQQRSGRADLTVLDGRLSGPVVDIPRDANSDTLLDGFTVRNGRASGGAGGGGIRCLGSPTISHNVITANATDDKGSYPGGGILCTGRMPTIRDNLVVANSGSAGISIAYGGARIVHNTFAANNGAAIALVGPIHPETVIANNIMANGMVGIDMSVPMAVGIHHNCFFGNAVANAMAARKEVVLPGNMTADPAFVDAEHGQFHLQPFSPCVDAGDDALVEDGESDIDLLPRRMGERVDIGADESDGRLWPPAFVPVVHVRPDGLDASDGLTWATAKGSVQAGIDLAAELGGGEVWVAAGDYKAQVVSPMLRTAVALRPFVHAFGGFTGIETTRGERDWKAHTTILEQADTLPAVGVTAGHRACTLDGFVIVGAQATAISYGGGVTFSSASANLRNNAILGFRGSGIYCLNAAPLIERNAVRGNVYSDYNGAIYATGSAPVIRNNVIASNTIITPSTRSGAIVVWTGKAVVQNNLIQDNTFGIRITDARATVTNNTLVNNGETAIGANVSSDVTFVNNISAFHDKEPMVADIQLRPAIRHNCVFDATVRDFPAGRNGNIVTSPDFVDLLAGDYRLLSSSPCIDSGDDDVVGGGDVDLDGNPRILGAHADMGAFESPWFGVVPRSERATALMRIVGGLTPATIGGMAADTGVPQGLDIADVLRALQ